MRSTWMLAAVVAVGLVGCGGGSEPEKRTYLACGNADACMEMQSVVPAEMTCTAPEVPSCDTGSILGTCRRDVLDIHMTLYVYAADKLAIAEQECRSQGGTWTLTSAGAN